MGMPSEVIWQAPPAQWAARLRGERYYQFYEALGRAQVIRQAQSVQVRPTTVVVLYMPTVVMTGRQVVIADVTADMLGLVDPPSPGMVAAHEEANMAEALTYWRRPEVMDDHVWALRAATMIITSWMELVGPLAQLTGRPTVHVPDFRRTGRAFRHGMAQVWRLIAEMG